MLKVIVELAGVTAVVVGVGMLSLPVAIIAAGLAAVCIVEVHA